MKIVLVGRDGGRSKRLTGLSKQINKTVLNIHRAECISKDLAVHIMLGLAFFWALHVAIHGFEHD